MCGWQGYKEREEVVMMKDRSVVTDGRQGGVRGGTERRQELPRRPTEFCFLICVEVIRVFTFS